MASSRTPWTKKVRRGPAKSCLPYPIEFSPLTKPTAIAAHCLAHFKPGPLVSGGCDHEDLVPPLRAVLAEGLVLTASYQMPLIYVDLHDGKNFVKDKQGFDVPNKEVARERLVRIMAKIARSLSADSDRQDYLAIAREADGKILFRVRLSLDIEEIDHP